MTFIVPKILKKCGPQGRPRAMLKAAQPCAWQLS